MSHRTSNASALPSATREYVKVHEHRAAALDRGDLIATSSWSIAPE
jgi:hypothetical protein